MDLFSGQDEDEELSADQSAHPFMLKELWRYLQCLQETEAKQVQLGQYQRQAEGTV